jgi:hypothetical protein
MMISHDMSDNTFEMRRMTSIILPRSLKVGMTIESSRGRNPMYQTPERPFALQLRSSVQQVE